ncbi:MAG TPA: acyltransferase family protein [Bradyrhizobium sp.]|nr:acyltransferase family protein [Bradyrhizobium sp.]
MLDRSRGEGSYHDGGRVVAGRRTSAAKDLPYRADIDGLRALSILLVVGYHAQPWLVPGGFIGVDIFFVISGFLITRIILTEDQAGHFSSLQFYARRIRRIFPALIVVLAVTYLIGWFVLLPDGFSLLGQSTAAGVAFVSNLFQLSQTGYFAPDAGENPLLHLWSLGIEEQFYIFWPLLLLALVATKRQRLWIAIIAATSFAMSLAILLGYKEWSFYSPISRAWELLAGGILANWLFESGAAKTPRLPLGHDLLAAIGIVAIAAASVALNKDSLFPGIYALAPVGGAVLIILSPHSALNRILLSSRPMVLIGLISYPLYLWHWPLLSYLAILRNGVPNVLEIWATVLLGFVLAWLTYRFVEIPLRRKRNAAVQLSFALLTVGVLGAVTAIGSGFGFRFPAEIREIAMIPPQRNAGFRDKCFLEGPGAGEQGSCIEPGAKPLLFLWGDSTAAALYPGLKKVEETVPFRLAYFVTAGCAPILAAGTLCDTRNDHVFDLVKSSKPQIVLLHAMWDPKFHSFSKLGETVARLKALKIPRIVILGPVPVWKRTLPLSLVNTFRFRHVVAERIASGVTGAASDEQVRSFSQAAGVEYISAWRVLCDQEGCITRVGPKAEDVVTTDIVHLSDAGSNFLLQGIEGSLFPR